jgi:hypothetical protein
VLWHKAAISFATACPLLAEADVRPAGRDTTQRQSAAPEFEILFDVTWQTWSRFMARTYLVFGDIEGKLDVLRVEYTRCTRKGQYRVRQPIEKCGRDASMMKWNEQLNGDCPRRNAPQLHERCDLICPDLL